MPIIHSNRKKKPKSKHNPQAKVVAPTVPAVEAPANMPRCKVTLEFEGQEDTLTLITDDYVVDLRKKVTEIDGKAKLGDAYFVIHGYLAD